MTISCPHKNHEVWPRKEFLHLTDMYHIKEEKEEEEIFGSYWLNNYAIETHLDVKYNKLDTNEVISNHNYLNTDQKQD